MKCKPKPLAVSKRLSGAPISDAHADSELMEILRELRDELRRFNDVLENQRVDPNALEKIRDKALKAGAVTFAGTVGLGAAGLFVTSLGGFLDYAGLMEWNHFIEFIKAVRG